MEHKQVATTLEVLGWIVLVSAFIAGFVLGDVQKETIDISGYTYTEEFSWRIALGVWFTGLIIGFILVGFARVIELLLEIRDSIREVPSGLIKQRWKFDSRNNKETP
jgi:hypothetical protein